MWGKFPRSFPTFKALTGPLIVCKDLAPRPKIETHTMTLKDWGKLLHQIYFLQHID